jgi:ADP-ribose pyrophosphatase YjhB (NUDIX family)
MKDAMEHSAGCIVYKMLDGQPLFAMMLDRYGQWTFPKGHIELVTRLGEIRYSFAKDGKQIEKQVEWFLAIAAPHTELQKADAQAVKEVGWLEYQEALKRNGYKQMRALLKLANRIVNSL